MLAKELLAKAGTLIEASAQTDVKVIHVHLNMAICDVSHPTSSAA